MPKNPKPVKVKPAILGLDQLPFLVDRYYSLQEHRIALSLQMQALKKQERGTELLSKFHDEFLDFESEIEKHVTRTVKQHPIYPWLKSCKGIGPIIAASLISQIDITKAEHASSVWKYCGLAVDLETGKAERREKGKKISWNPFLKKTCWKIGESFVKSKGKYRTIYDTSKKYYQEKFPKEVKDTKSKRVFYTKGHIHALSKRRAVKLFLADFWVEWRKLEGLPVSVPFMHRGDANFKYPQS